MSKTIQDLIIKFNEEINKTLKSSWDLQLNNYGAKFSVGFEDQILKSTNTKLKKEIPSIQSFENGKNEPFKIVMITKSNFEKYFDLNLIKYEELAGKIIALKKKIIEINTKTSSEATDATESIQGIIKDGEETKHVIVDFFSTNSFGTKYTEADDKFWFSRLRKDSEKNLYVLLKENELFRIEIKPNTERTMLGNSLSENTQFWPAFFKTFEKSFKEWDTIIKNTIQEYDFEESEKSIEQTLMEGGVPRLYLECNKLDITLRKVVLAGDNGKPEILWVFKKVDTKLNIPGENKTYNTSNLIQVFSEKLLLPVDINRVNTIPLYSNDENEVAVKHICHPSSRWDSTKPPQLPPTWKKFLGGDRFYDKIMDKMKIAHFVDNILNANYSGRQILVIGGEGSDGKGVFLNVLAGLIGREHSISVNSSAFSIDDSFGLQEVVNKKFIYLSDCKSVSKLFAEDKFKAISGGDVIPINRKNLKVMNWKPQGLCLAIATNNNFYVNSEHGRSRAMPLVFRKNFKQSEKVSKSEMEMLLLSEKDEFIQWCADYKYWLNKIVCKGHLIHGDELVICTDEDISMFASDDFDDFEMFKRMCEKQQLNGGRFCNWNERSEAEEEDYENLYECFDEIVKRFRWDKESWSFSVTDYGTFQYDYIYRKGEKFCKPIDVLQVLQNEMWNNPAKRGLLRSCEKSEKDFNPHSKLMAGWITTKHPVKNIRCGEKIYKTLIPVENLKSPENITKTYKSLDDVECSCSLDWNDIKI